MKLKLLTAAMLAMAIAPMQANALTTTAALQVSATVVTPSASILVAGPLAFGQILEGQTGTATTSFDVTVSNNVPYAISFGEGLSLVQNRFRFRDVAGIKPGTQITPATEYLLWSDSTKVTAYLADVTNAPVISGVTGNGAAQTYTLYAESLVPAGLGAANYADTITITVTY